MRLSRSSFPTAAARLGLATVVGAIVVGAIVAAPVPAGGQAGGRARLASESHGTELAAATPTPMSPADSARIRKAARTAQERFERFRFRHLPWTHDRAGGEECDERLGRFCIWYEGDDETRPPPAPEPQVVRDDREVLIERLRAAAVLLPGDEWLAGQLVRYLVEGGHADQALESSTRCAAAPWWCAALAGFARHAAGDFAAADSSFAMALAGMPDDLRARWSDLGPLLDPDDAGARERQDAAHRDSLDARVWWLADPLWMVPGNERRTEHFARHVLDRLHDRARSTEGLVWGADLSQLLLRFGSPVAWERIVPPYPRAEPPAVRTRYAPHGRHFFPPLRAADSLGAVDDASWADARRSRTEYAPGYAAAGFRGLRTQIARFRRGDSTLVVAAFDLTGDTSMVGGSDSIGERLDAALVIERGPGELRAIAHDSMASPRATLSARFAGGPAVLSVEALARGRHRASRSRVGITPLRDAAPAAISDLLMLDVADALPRSLTKALPLARGDARWRSGERVAVFWEMYRTAGDSAGEPVSLSLAFYESRRGIATRIARRIGLLGGPVDVALQWTERGTGDPITPRAIVLQLPALSPGRYQLRLTASLGDGTEVVAAKEVEVGK